MTAPLVGDRVVAFDADAWEKVGHDVGDNECFWKAATVVAVRHNGEEAVADLRFHRSARVSVGHFVSALRRAPALSARWIARRA